MSEPGRRPFDVDAHPHGQVGETARGSPDLLERGRGVRPDEASAGLETARRSRRRQRFNPGFELRLAAAIPNFGFDTCGRARKRHLEGDVLRRLDFGDRDIGLGAPPLNLSCRSPVGTPASAKLPAASALAAIVVPTTTTLRPEGADCTVPLMLAVEPVDAGGVDSVIHAVGGEQDMRRMGGLRKLIPVTFWVVTIATIAIAGIPPFAGFFSKDEILGAVFHSPYGGPVIWGIGVLTAGLTSFYMFRLWFMTSLASSSWAQSILAKKRIPRTLRTGSAWRSLTLARPYR